MQLRVMKHLYSSRLGDFLILAHLQSHHEPFLQPYDPMMPPGSLGAAKLKETKDIPAHPKIQLLAWDKGIWGNRVLRSVDAVGYGWYGWYLP